MARRIWVELLASFFFLIGSLHSVQAQEPHTAKEVGKVRYYERGTKIGIDIRPKVEKTYDLASKDTTYLVDPDVQVGSNVEMEESKDENGKKLVKIRVRNSSGS